VETLPVQFDKALTRIEPNGTKRARAIAAHGLVRAQLETSDTLCEWGVDTVLIGSYARSTAIYPGNDVDVFTKLTALDTKYSAAVVFEEVCGILTDHYGDRADPRNRSVKIAFYDDSDKFSVDVVPAVLYGERWAIPDHDRDRWVNSDAAWIETDPEQLSQLTNDMNESVEVSGRGAYVPIVKLMRQARSHHRGDAKPGGLFIELVTYEAFTSGVSGESFAELFAGALAYAGSRLASAAVNPILDPALGTPYTPSPPFAETMECATLFSTLAGEANKSLGLPKCEAAVIWRQILGSNDRGPVFPIPPGCDESGNVVGAVTANRARGPNEARGFA
jgi:hypothetical protein